MSVCIRPPSGPFTLRPDPRGLLVDLFAGGGGASLGTEMALGRSPDLAVNHNWEAVAMHIANHPNTHHLIEDVRKVDILKVTQGFPVWILWLSPDCKHHSKAKGGKPLDRKIRGLAWEAVRWAKTLGPDRQPRIIALENVQEFKDWGPLTKKTGRPDPLQKGFTYRRFKRELEKLGYVVEDRMLRACNYGTPTTRERLFLVARCDKRPIVWPKATHSKDGRDLAPWRIAAECIDFSVPCPSIFISEAEGKRLGFPRIKRPLKEKSQRRIYRGIDKFVIKNPRPFIVSMYHQNAPKSVDDPLQTVTTQGNKFNLVTPLIAKFRHDSAGSSIESPLPTITAGPAENPAGAAHAMALVAPSIVRMAHGEQDASGKRRGKGEHPIGEPLGSVTASGDFALSAPTLVPVNHGGDLRTHSVEDPLRTITGAHRGEEALVSAVLCGTGGPERAGEPKPIDQPIGTVLPEIHRALIAPVMVPRYGEREGQAPRARSVEQPAATVVPTQNGDNLVAAHLVKHYGGAYEGAGSQLPLPIDVVTPQDHHALATSHLMKLKGTCQDGQPVEEPIHTIQAGGLHYAEVRAFLMKYHGSGGQWNDLLDPAPTVVGNDSFGLVYVEGHPYSIVDIGMRMLMARELFRCNGFPETYIIDPVCERWVWVNKKKNKKRMVVTPLPGEAQVRMCGNSVPPQFVKAILTANLSDEVPEELDYQLAMA